MKIDNRFKGMLKKREKDSHKGDYGNIFVLAGSRGYTGAAALCSNACLRAGAGVVMLGISQSLNIAMEIKLTEVMTLPLPETSEGSFALSAKDEILRKLEKFDEVILGPGLSVNEETKELVLQLIKEIPKPMVIDADALNAISRNTSILKEIKSDYIITPHVGEMARLTGKDIEYIKNNRITIAKDFANQYNAVVVLKGFETVVADSNAKSEVYVNKSGNPGMATAGSGDVLTGVIAGLVAQRLKLFDAAKMGVYIHGVAGDLARDEKGEVGLIAGDILEKIPEAIKLVQ